MDNNINNHIVKARHPFTEAFEMFCKNIAAVIALVVLFLIILTAIFGPTLYPVDPFDMVWMPFSPPGEEGFIFGTDYLGRDLVAMGVRGNNKSLGQ